MAFAEKVREDYSKCLHNENLTREEKSEILKGEMKILKMVDSKIKEVRKQQEKILSTVEWKDLEKIPTCKKLQINKTVGVCRCV